MGPPKKKGPSKTPWVSCTCFRQLFENPHIHTYIFTCQFLYSRTDTCTYTNSSSYTQQAVPSSDVEPQTTTNTCANANAKTSAAKKKNTGKHIHITQHNNTCVFLFCVRVHFLTGASVVVHVSVRAQQVNPTV